MSRIPSPVVSPITPEALQGVAIGAQNLNEEANRRNQAAIAAGRNATELQVNREQLAAQASEHAKYQEFLAQQQASQQSHASGMQASSQAHAMALAEAERAFQEKLAKRSLELQMLVRKQEEDLRSVDDDMLEDMTKQYLPLKKEQEREAAKLGLITMLANQKDPQSKKAIQQVLDQGKNQVAAQMAAEKHAEDALVFTMADKFSSLSEKPTATDTPFQKWYKAINTTFAQISIPEHIGSLFGLLGDPSRTPLDVSTKDAVWIGKEPKTMAELKAKEGGKGSREVAGLLEAAGIDPARVATKDVLRASATALNKMLIGETAGQFIENLAATPGVPPMNSASLEEAKGLATGFLTALHKASSVYKDGNAGSPEANRAAEATIVEQEVKPALQKLAAVIGEPQALSLVRKMTAISRGQISASSSNQSEALLAKSLGMGDENKRVAESETKLRKAMAAEWNRMGAVMNIYKLDTEQKSAASVNMAFEMLSRQVGEADSYGTFVAKAASQLGMTPEEVDRKFPEVANYFKLGAEYGGPNTLAKVAEAEQAKVLGLGDLLKEAEVKQTESGVAKKKALRAQQQQERESTLDRLLK